MTTYKLGEWYYSTLRLNINGKPQVFHARSFTRSLAIALAMHRAGLV